MLHLFTLNHTHLAFDTESYALHIPDDLSFRVLSAYVEAGGCKPDQVILNRLEQELGGETQACIREIDTLIAGGALFTPGETVSPELLYPDQPRIKSMCLHLCHDCNMRCRYCFAGTGDFGTGKRSMLDYETGCQAVEFLLAASGGRHNLDIDFFGGEPLMNWPVVEALTAYCERRAGETGKNIRLTITTNALLLDEAKTAFINQHFKNCVLSIDGRQDVHDFMRPDAGGHGTYKRVADHIRSFVAARGEREYYLRGTFTHHNLDFSADVLHLASLGSQVSVEPVVAPPGCGYEIRPEDLPAIEREYEKLAQAMLAADSRDEPFNFFHFMIDLEQGPCAYKRLKGCGVGLEYCAVTPDGEIYPCHQFVGLPQFLMGHVQDQPVRLDAAVQEQFRHLLVPDKPECQTCWARYFCSGGCAANAYHASGSVNGQYEMGCRMQKKRLECALWLMSQRRLQTQENRLQETGPVAESD
ncbi:MAG: thioether cross-link-forming SCIFF peptide maturase [Clostridiaceae bacterium]|nr:thioether cross-link-forming SCIFF peptide maturase [Clostridiaceae bacterium]